MATKTDKKKKSAHFKIESDVPSILHMLQAASDFTDSEDSAQDYYRYVLIEASGTTVRATASSSTKSIQISESESVKILGEGRVLVSVGTLIGVLRNIVDTDDVTIEYLDATKRLLITSGSYFKTRIGVEEIRPKTTLPSISTEGTEGEERVGFVLDASDFAEVLERVQTQRAIDGSYRVYSGVLAHPQFVTTDDAKIAFMSINGKASTYRDATKVQETFGDIETFPKVILDVNLTRSILGLIQEGSRFEMYTYPSCIRHGANGDMITELFYNVYNESEELVYLIKTATLGIAGDEFKEHVVVNAIKSSVLKNAAFSFSVGKSELLGLMRQASNIGSMLDADLILGQTKAIMVEFKDGSMRAFLSFDDDDEFTNSITVDTDLEGEEQMRIPFGLVGDTFSRFNSDTLHFIASKAKGANFCNTLFLFDPEGALSVAPKSGENVVGPEVDPENLPEAFALLGLYAMDKK